VATARCFSGGDAAFAAAHMFPGATIAAMGVMVLWHLLTGMVLSVLLMLAQA